MKTLPPPVTGDIPDLMENVEGLYEGTLAPYMPIVFKFARNLNLPYHNFGHMFHVMWRGHDACRYYRYRLSKLEMRDMLVGELFHDFDHLGRLGNDEFNIALALQALRKHALPEDRPRLSIIEPVVECTQFPYREDMADTAQLPLIQQITRDADMMQALSPTWIQQVIFGLAEEWRMTPVEVLTKQGPFMKNLRFHTEWAQKLFPPEAIAAKIREANRLLELAQGKTATLS